MIGGLPDGLSRREFLSLSSTAALAIAGAAGCGGDSPVPEPEPTPQPIAPARNVVLFLSDDQRADVFGHLGHPTVSTPNFDRLAADGVSATRLYTVALDCQPSRVSLFTSLYQKTHGVVDNSAEVPDSLLFLAEVLRDAGLATGGFGKLHDGTNAGQGLVEIKPFISAQSPYHSRFIHWDNEAIQSGRSSLYAKECPTHTITDQGIEFIRRNAHRRFFALISIPEPHTPYLAPDPYYSRVDPARVLASGFNENKRFWQDKNPGWAEYYAQIWSGVSDKDLRRCLASYYANVEFLDTEFGRVRQALEQEGVLDETILMYMSDHGEAAGLGGVMGKSGLLYEPIVRQPLVLRYPALGVSGLKLDALMENVDVAPTVLDLLGLPVPSVFEGTASTQVLRGGRAVRSDAISRRGQDLSFMRMVRTERYKLIEYADGLRELYDLMQDPDEVDNRIATADPGVLQDLLHRLERA